MAAVTGIGLPGLRALLVFPGPGGRRFRRVAVPALRVAAQRLAAASTRFDVRSAPTTRPGLVSALG